MGLFWVKCVLAGRCIMDEVIKLKCDVCVMEQIYNLIHETCCNGGTADW